jgi:integrase
VRFLAAAPSLKDRMAPITAYAAVLRVSEAVRLRVVDIDSERTPIRVHRGKSSRDRYIMLLVLLLRVLRPYWRQHDRRIGCSRARREPAARSASAAAQRTARAGRSSASRPRSIRYATASPPTCAKPATTPARLHGLEACSEVSVGPHEGHHPRSGEGLAGQDYMLAVLPD